MMRLFLIEKNGDRKIDLGLFKYNTEADCINAARRKHRFLAKMETHGFDFKGVQEPGPLRIPKMPRREVDQLTIDA